MHQRLSTESSPLLFHAINVVGVACNNSVDPVLINL